MRGYVFDDIYGNQCARDRYEHHREFSYFNTYYEDNNMHNYIFSPKKITQKLSPLPSAEKKPKFTYYSVEKINNMTFRINKKNLKADKSKKSLTISAYQHGGKDDLKAMQTSRLGHKDTARDIMKDAQFLKATLREGGKSKMQSRYERDGAHLTARLSAFAVNRELKNFVEFAKSSISH